MNVVAMPHVAAITRADAGLLDQLAAVWSAALGRTGHTKICTGLELIVPHSATETGRSSSPVGKGRSNSGKKI